MLDRIISKLKNVADLANVGGLLIVMNKANNIAGRIERLRTSVRHYSAISSNEEQALIHRIKAEYFESLETADLARTPNTAIGDDCADLMESVASDMLVLSEEL